MKDSTLKVDQGRSSVALEVGQSKSFDDISEKRVRQIERRKDD